MSELELETVSRAVPKTEIMNFCDAFKPVQETLPLSNLELSTSLPILMCTLVHFIIYLYFMVSHLFLFFNTLILP